MNGIQDRLIEKMLEPRFYDHPVAEVELIETHISRIFLAGEFAYKLKKPVNFGFLDFSSPEQRRFYCHEELRLNRRFAPQLYLEVCSVGGPSDSPKLRKDPALDFLVKMKRFPCRAQLDRVLEDGRLSNKQLEAFAVMIADFHQRATIVNQSAEFGAATAVIEPVLENFSQLAPILPTSCSEEQFNALERWSRNACETLRESLRRRKREGYIRECHGDIHLANMIWWDEQPLLFDCIEFNENLRWIDLINEIAFLAMDLDDRGETTLGWFFLNRYLQQTGDYRGVELLAFYKVYRAMVRAKVACLRLCQPGLDSTEQAKDRQLATSYLELADRYIQQGRPQLIITHGLSGSGKTSFINALAPLCNAIRIHSDVERKRLAGLAATDDSNSPPAGGIYSSQATASTYLRLSQLTEFILDAGISVMVDATYLKRRQRQQMRQLAARCGIPFRILDFPLAEEELRQRIARRKRQPGQFSEASVEILEMQLDQQELLSHDEQQSVIRIYPASSVSEVAGRINR